MNIAVRNAVLLICSITLAFGLLSCGKTAAKVIKTTVNKTVVDNKIGRPKLGSVVRLVREGRTYCSGVVIDPTTIVTAAHCVLINTPFGPWADEDTPIEIRGADNKFRSTYGRLKSASTQIDRAVIKGNFSIYQSSKYISDMAQSVAVRHQGQRMVSCGYPLGGALFCNEMVYIKELAFFMTVKGLLVPGMSGGPTMLPDGTVIGINSAVEADYSIIAPLYNVEMFK